MENKNVHKLSDENLEKVTGGMIIVDTAINKVVGFLFQRQISTYRKLYA